MSKKTQKNIKEQAVLAALALAADRGWDDITLDEIAKKAKITPAAFAEHFKTKFDVLVALGRMIDAQTLAAIGTPDPALSPRDRLFDILMERFDVLNEQREGINAILKSLCRTPKQGIISLPWLGYSMSQMLQAAKIDTEGFSGAAKVIGLTGVYLKTLKTWQKDDSPDMGRTMAALDKNLGHAEKLAGRMGFTDMELADEV